jgi:glycosyltransferase involved in cell wall biosynthesis
VIAAPGPQRYFPLDRRALGEGAAALADWLRSRGVGLVHVHSIAPGPRARAEWAIAQLGVPFVATLHDVLFLRRDGFVADEPLTPDPAWIAATGAFLREGAEVVAPSHFIAGLAREHAGVTAHVIPNGIGTPAPSSLAQPHPEFAARRPRAVVAALGAIGPHKGSRLLEEAAERLASHGIVVVVVGYTDRAVSPGWFADNLFIHGPYLEQDAAALLAAYGAGLVLFTNRVPESFSYALSDAWRAGVPVLVPPEGALAERVRAHGGGWTLPARFDAAAIASAVVEQLEGRGTPSLTDVESALRVPDAARVPTRESMNDALEALYTRHGLAPGAPVDAGDDAVQSLLATHLDGDIFRKELTWLAGEVKQLREEQRKWQAREVEMQQWTAKLGADIQGLQGEMRNEIARREAVEREHAAEYQRRLAYENETLAASLRRHISPHVPRWVKRLLGKGRDARD